MAFNNETDKIILELTLDELKLIDKYVEYNDETKSVFDKIKYAYPQIKMTLENEGEFAVVSYNDTTYYRFMNETTFAWYIKKGVSVTHPVPTLVMITDAETERLLDGLYYNHIVVKKEKVSEWEPTPQTPEETEQSLKEAFREAIKQGIIPEVKQPTDELIEKLTKKPPEFLKFELGKTLEQIIERDYIKNYPLINRVEVISDKGREFVQYDCSNVQISEQDNGRTLKVFLS